MPKKPGRRENRKLDRCDVGCEAKPTRNGRKARGRRIDDCARYPSLRPGGAVPEDQSRVEVVLFYKELLDHRGFPHRCELMRVCADGAVQAAVAICGAIHRFEKLERVSTWKIAADGYEVISTPARDVVSA
ncbi:hypothetical protein [Paraburkholderia sp. EG304]|uniref:hypothetical protein n=1 Tax=Paraburkholderia sp. EG304 TaxID=3237015 RepID=UPI00397E7F31